VGLRFGKLEVCGSGLVQLSYNKGASMTFLTEEEPKYGRGSLVAGGRIRSAARGRFYNVVALVNWFETRRGHQDRPAEHLTRADLIVFDELSIFHSRNPATSFCSTSSGG
jgi:hypothetical protein